MDARIVRFPQPLNALQPISVTLLGIHTLVIRLQSSNAPVSILVTLLGIVTFDRLLQPANNSYDVSVTPSGIDALSNPLHPLKARGTNVQEIFNMRLT